MNERLSYRMHTIDLELMEIRPQRFRWLYMIDSAHFQSGTDILQPEPIARANALVIAHSHIDTLELIALTPKKLAPLRPNGLAPIMHGGSLPGAAASSIDRSEESRRRTTLRRCEGESLS